jgi:hypothetical protein|tara:strand:- start:46 stop:552 length:507 start_codon:yes stop_codon:yes gene_type:complete
MNLQPLDSVERAPKRRSAFDVPPSASTASAAGSTTPTDALARALQLAEQLNGAASGRSAPPPPPKRTLAELLARDTERIARADAKNRAYVQSLEDEAAARSAAAVAAMVAVAAEQAAGGGKSKKKGNRTFSFTASAGCSVYVEGLPQNVTWSELEKFFKQVSVFDTVP